SMITHSHCEWLGMAARQVRIDSLNGASLPNIHLRWLYGWFGCLRADRPVMAGPKGALPAPSCPPRLSPNKTPPDRRGAGRQAPPPAGTRKRSIAVQETGRCGSADGSVVTGARLDVRNLAQTPGGHLGAGLPKVLSMVVSRRYEGTHGRLDQAAARLSGGPPDRPAPPAPVTSTSPLTRALRSVPGG